MNLAIVGGGIAGLTAAFDLAGAGANVTVLEEGPTPGGQVRTRRERGYVVEDGAEGFVAADPHVPALCDDLGIAAELIPQRERRALLLQGGRLTSLASRDAAIMLGIPVARETESAGILSLRGGMGRLVEALSAAVHRRGATIVAGVRVDGMEPQGGGWRLTAGSTYTHDADAVILALPPRPAAHLLAPRDAEAAAVLQGIVLHGNLSVSVAYDRADVAHDLKASGITVGPGETGLFGLRACAFCSSKFDHRSPARAVLLRAFYRPDAAGLQSPDAEWVDRTHRALREALGISGQPLARWVARWPAAIPEYGPDHAGRIASIAGRLGRVALAGAAYLPGGLPGAVRSGREAARNLAASPLRT